MPRNVTALVASAAACLMLPPGPARADNWPAFRGAGGQSVSTESGLPTEWSPDRNVRWRAPLPGRGNGSPIVWGDRVFIAQAVDKDKRRTVMCFDRAAGNLLWQSGVTHSDPEPHHPDNPYASGTPATDGERVIACFGSAGLLCYDFAGKELWRRDLGKLNHMFGNAISPVIAGDKVLLNFGPGEGARVVAVDKRSGEVLWQAEPPKADESERTMTPARLGGPAFPISQALFGKADKDGDSMLTGDEMRGAAEAWFDALDPEKTGKVAKEQFGQRFAAMAPPGPPGAGWPNVVKLAGDSLFAAVDGNTDATLTREEVAAAFGSWYGAWGGGNNEPLDLNQLLDGVAQVVPAPQRPPGGPGAGRGGPAGPDGSWSTPIVVTANGREEVVVAFSNRLVAFDLASGKRLWFARGLSDAVHPTPIFADGLIIATSSDMAGGTILAVRPGGSGDVTTTHIAWRQPRTKGSIGTGVVHDGRLYAIATDGFAVCYDTKTGKRLHQKRLEAAGDKGNSWSSMLLAGDKIYVPNQSGDVFVLKLKADGRFDVLATNSVNEPTNASLAASGGSLFLRTDKALWCFGAGK